LKSVVCDCERPIPKECLKKCMTEIHKKSGADSEEIKVIGDPPKPKGECCACGESSKEKNIGCECIFCADCLSK